MIHNYIGNKMDDSLINLSRDLLSTTLSPFEKWILEGCLLTSVDFGAVSYGTDALAEITASIQPDRCILVY